MPVMALDEFSQPVKLDLFTDEEREMPIEAYAGMLYFQLTGDAENPACDAYDAWIIAGMVTEGI